MLLSSTTPSTDACLVVRWERFSPPTSSCPAARLVCCCPLLDPSAVDNRNSFVVRWVHHINLVTRSQTSLAYLIIIVFETCISHFDFMFPYFRLILFLNIYSFFQICCCRDFFCGTIQRNKPQKIHISHLSPGFHLLEPTCYSLELIVDLDDVLYFSK